MLRCGCLLVAASIASGCVIIPYPTGADVSQTSESPIDPSSLLVNTAPRELIEEFVELIRTKDGAITVVDPKVFSDAALLDDDAHLSQLLAAPNSARVRERTGANYLVLLGTPQKLTSGPWGVPLMEAGIPLGVGKWDTVAAHAVAIFDLRTAKPMGYVKSVARGSELAVSYGLTVAAIPTVIWSATRGLAAGVVSRLREHAGEGPLTVAVMTADPVRGSGPGQRMIDDRAKPPTFKPEPGLEPASPAEGTLIRSIQEGLQKVGYTWVPVDGRLDSWTRAAIRNFQSSSEYSGPSVDDMPSERLRVDIERAIPKWIPFNQPLFRPASDLPH